MNLSKTTISDKQKQFLDEFLKKSTKRYILGINKYSDSIYSALQKQGLDIVAFIDDFTKNTHHKNKPIIKTQSLKEGKIIVAVTCSTLIAIENLEKLNNDDIDFMDYFAFQKHSGLDLAELEFCDNFINEKTSSLKDFRDDFSRNAKEYEKIYDLLEDEDSKKHFEGIINFRLTQNYGFIKNLSINPAKQYFDDFIDFSKIDTFFDCGGYRGETSLDFIAKNKNYKNIYFFEPFKESFEEAKKNLVDIANVSFFNIAVGDKKETLYLHTCLDNSANYLSKDIKGTRGTEIDCTKINVDSLDNLYNLEKMRIGGGPMIKMDIEAAERAAIMGAKNIITKYKPTLAICVYHRVDDFFRIPDLILGICGDYKLYFRHYSTGLVESVMYFAPK